MGERSDDRAATRARSGFARVIAALCGALGLEPPRRWGGLALLGLPVVLGVAIGAAGAAFPPTREAALSVYQSMRHAVLTRPEYRVRFVEVVGAVHLDDREVVAALALDRIGRATLGFDARAARARVEALGWVERASVFVRPPQTLEIRVVERTPAALWRVGGAMRLLDAGGVTIAPVDSRERWPHLPLFVGEGVDAALAEGVALVTKASDAGLEVAALTRIGARRWDLDLVGGPRVMLPEAGAEAAIEQFVAWTARADLLRRDFAEVDLRLPFAPMARLRRAAEPVFGPEPLAPAETPTASTAPAG